MNKLNKKLERLAAKETVWTPVFFDLAKTADQTRLNKLLVSGDIRQVRDDYREQLHELFAINNPTIVYTPNFEKEFESYFKKLVDRTPLAQQGKWVLFPWLHTVVHILDDNDFQKVRTARNRNLISTEEQEKFYNSVIGIGGLSVGSSVASAIVLQGGAKHLRLADFDSLALSNTNRIRAGVQNLGLNKVEMIARQIYEINPYSKIELFKDGLTKENIKKFFAGPPKLDVVIDELDNLAIKYLIREKAKIHKTPLVMAADNGDNAVVDVERYDLNQQTKFFHGRLGDITYDELLHLDKFGIGKTITKHIGAENVTEKMQNSLLEMGKTIVSWPQLGGAALINGSAVAYCVRKILNDQPLENNRALISLDEKLIPNYNSKPQIQHRQKISANFKKMFGL